MVLLRSKEAFVLTSEEFLSSLPASSAALHKKSLKTVFCTKSLGELRVNSLDFLGKSDFLCKAN
jgi:hypothetical protein